MRLKNEWSQGDPSCAASHFSCLGWLFTQPRSWTVWKLCFSEDSVGNMACTTTIWCWNSGRIGAPKYSGPAANKRPPRHSPAQLGNAPEQNSAVWPGVLHFRAVHWMAIKHVPSAWSLGSKQKHQSSWPYICQAPRTFNPTSARSMSLSFSCTSHVAATDLGQHNAYNTDLIEDQEFPTFVSTRLPSVWRS